MDGTPTKPEEQGTQGGGPTQLSYIKNSEEPERDSGDPCIGCDRFGRTVDMKWQTSDRAAMLDRVLHGYDRASYE